MIIRNSLFPSYTTVRKVVTLMVIGVNCILFYYKIMQSLPAISSMMPEAQYQGNGSISVDVGVDHTNKSMPMNDENDEDIVPRPLSHLDLQASHNNQSLSFTTQTGQTFWAATPKNASFVASDAGVTNFTGKVSYLRNHGDITQRGQEGECARTLDVLAWLMDQMNKNGSRLVIAYGGLIHIHREKEFVNVTTGKYIDDDIDMWAAPEAIVHVGQLEEELFTQFGWSMRVFITAREKFVLLMQVFASCGHHIRMRRSKLKSSEPAIEIYPIVAMNMMSQHEGETNENDHHKSRVVKDLWQETMLAESLVHPPKRVDFKSAGTNNTMYLQLPNQALEIMECLYGNWRVPSSQHAGLKKRCMGM